MTTDAKAEAVGLRAVSLLSGLLGDTEDCGHLCPGEAAEAKVGDLPLDIPLDVATASDEGLEMGCGSHASRIVDAPPNRQEFLTETIEARR